MKDFGMNHQNVFFIIFQRSMRLFVGVRPEHEFLRLNLTKITII